MNSKLIAACANRLVELQFQSPYQPFFNAFDRLSKLHSDGHIDLSAGNLTDDGRYLAFAVVPSLDVDGGYDAHTHPTFGHPILGRASGIDFRSHSRRFPVLDLNNSRAVFKVVHFPLRLLLERLRERENSSHVRRQAANEAAKGIIGFSYCLENGVVKVSLL